MCGHSLVSARERCDSDRAAARQPSAFARASRSRPWDQLDALQNFTALRVAGPCRLGKRAPLYGNLVANMTKALTALRTLFMIFGKSVKFYEKSRSTTKSTETALRSPGYP